MITSEYLEKVVDFDKPVLVVGQGIEYYDGLEWDDVHAPMDRTVIWLAEKLAGKAGRLDLFDYKFSSSNCGNHDLNKVKSYFNRLSKKIPLGEIRCLFGDIAEYALPREEYAFIWDHETLEYWSSGHLSKTINIQERDKRIEAILANYLSSLRVDGRAAIAIRDRKDIIEKLENMNLQRRELTKDCCRSVLNAEHFQLKDAKQPYFLEDDS